MNDSAPPPSTPEALAGLIAAALAAGGQPPFSDGSLVELATGTRELLWIDDAAAALVSPTEAEFAVHPDARGHGLGTRMLDRLTADREELLLWAHGDHPAARALAASHGLHPVRELLQLRAEVPVAAGVQKVMVPFQPGIDEPAWLALNARTFANHPEQGRVTRAELDALQAEPWFDADDFLLLWDDDELLAYCWLKVTDGGTAAAALRDAPEPAGVGPDEIGEFYVVGVDPALQGQGLGRRLVEAGLARLAERGIREASLYVEADNAAALRLYRSFGFRQHSIDIQYRWAR